MADVFHNDKDFPYFDFTVTRKEDAQEDLVNMKIAKLIIDRMVRVI